MKQSVKMKLHWKIGDETKRKNETTMKDKEMKQSVKMKLH